MRVNQKRDTIGATRGHSFGCNNLLQPSLRAVVSKKGLHHLGALEEADVHPKRLGAAQGTRAPSYLSLRVLGTSLSTVILYVTPFLGSPATVPRATKFATHLVGTNRAGASRSE